MIFTLTKIKKVKFSRSFLRRMGVLCFITAFALVVAAYVTELPQVQKNLARVIAYFDSVELFIAGLNKGAAFGVILLLFFIKAFIPVVPLSVIFVASGMVFKDPVSACINLTGFCLLCAVKFLWGRFFGGGGTHRFITRINSIQKFMKLGGEGNKWMLVVLRFIPFMPVNTVSRLYGTTSIKLYEFLFYSALGYLPRLISWSVVGCNITNPFTVSFIIPVGALLIITGASLFLLDFFINNDRERNV